MVTLSNISSNKGNLLVFIHDNEYSYYNDENSHESSGTPFKMWLIKGYFIGTAHEQITSKFGGHGYPRTVLINYGNVADQNNVEVITKDTLSELARKFIQIIAG